MEPSALAGLARRPGLWPTAWRQWKSMAAPRWWARWPPWPGPPPEYASFRLEAMYGSGEGRLTEEELIGYLQWCRWMRSLTR